jgi:glycosyltransferase involved in cell wall biosynthesis
MRTLIICGSKSPTYCGIGKYVNKVINILPLSEEIIYLTDLEQSDYNSKDHNVIKDVITYQYNLKKFNLFLPFKLINLAFKIKPDRVIIHHQTFKKNYLDVFFNLFIKIGYYKVKTINVIHEFRHFSKVGKLRLVLAGLFSERILFSDISQKNDYNRFTNNIFTNKTKTTLIGNTNNNTLESYQLQDYNNSEIHIGYHGYIQPPKGLHLLLEALIDYKLPFKLHILGSFEKMLDNDVSGEVAEYNKVCEALIDGNETLHQSVLIHGDIDPSSQLFKEILKDVDLLIFPFIDYLTMRRSSFLTTVAASNAIAISTFSSEFSDPELAVFGGIEPSKDSILKYLNQYSALDKKNIQQKQIDIKNSVLSQEAVNARIIMDLMV